MASKIAPVSEPVAVPAPAARLVPKVLIVGAGLRPGCLSQEAVESLRLSPRVFLVNLQRELAASLVAALPNAVSLDYKDGSWSRWERDVVHRVVAALKKDKSVAVLLAGDPLVFSLGPRISALCSRLKIPYRLLPGLSTYNDVLALVEPLLRRRARLAYSAPLILCGAAELAGGRMPPRRDSSTMVVNLGGGGMGRGREAAAPLRDALAKAYGPDWLCCLVDVGVRSDARVEAFPIKDLGEHWARKDDHSTLFVPARLQRSA